MKRLLAVILALVTCCIYGEDLTPSVSEQRHRIINTAENAEDLAVKYQKWKDLEEDPLQKGLRKKIEAALEKLESAPRALETESPVVNTLAIELCGDIQTLTERARFPLGLHRTLIIQARAFKEKREQMRGYEIPADLRDRSVLIAKGDAIIALIEGKSAPAEKVAVKDAKPQSKVVPSKHVALRDGSSIDVVSEVDSGDSIVVKSTAGDFRTIKKTELADKQ